MPDNDLPQASSSLSTVNITPGEDWTSLDASYGPNVFARRRALWVSGSLHSNGATKSTNAANGSGSGPSRRSAAAGIDAALKRLDEVLAEPDVDEDESLWNDYLCEIHRRLVGGNKLRRGLRLNQAVRLGPCITWACESVRAEA